MRALQDAIVTALKSKFPNITVLANNAELDERTEGEISYPAPGILVTAINAEEVPVQYAPWELECNFGLTIAVKGASAIARDKDGWDLCMKAASVAYRNTWGFSAMYIQPAVIRTIQRNVVRTVDGVPTGVNYWSVVFYNWAKFEGLID